MRESSPIRNSSHPSLPAQCILCTCHTYLHTYIPTTYIHTCIHPPTRPLAHSPTHSPTHSPIHTYLHAPYNRYPFFFSIRRKLPSTSLTTVSLVSPSLTSHRLHSFLYTSHYCPHFSTYVHAAYPKSNPGRVEENDIYIVDKSTTTTTRVFISNISLTSLGGPVGQTKKKGSIIHPLYILDNYRRGERKDVKTRSPRFFNYNIIHSHSANL